MIYIISIESHHICRLPTSRLQALRDRSRPVGSCGPSRSAEHKHVLPPAGEKNGGNWATSLLQKCHVFVVHIVSSCHLTHKSPKSAWKMVDVMMYRPWMKADSDVGKHEIAFSLHLIIAHLLTNRCEGTSGHSFYCLTEVKLPRLYAFFWSKNHGIS